VKNISRTDFLKISGLSIGGVLMFPHHSCSGAGGNQKISINGNLNPSIILPVNPNPIELESANQLSLHFSLLTKQPPKIIKEDDYVGGSGIFIGKTKYAIDNDTESLNLKEDGYSFKNINNNFIIQGGSEKGLLFGVYSLLESFGFRKYAADDPLVVPKKN
tara:strand:- start:3 stop:485 length:483 start_codon:yes stop_codon:yes gene_type:complete